MGLRTLPHTHCTHFVLAPRPPQDFAYTTAAARRAEQRRLLAFVRVLDFMMGVSGPSWHNNASHNTDLAPTSQQHVCQDACAFARLASVALANALSRSRARARARAQDSLRACLAASAAELLSCIQQAPQPQPQPPPLQPAPAGRAPLFAVEVVLREGAPGEGSCLELEPSPSEFQARTCELDMRFT